MSDRQPAQNAAQQPSAQEAELQQEHDTSGLAEQLRQVQNDVESRERERTLKLARLRGEVDPPSATEISTENTEQES